MLRYVGKRVPIAAILVGLSLRPAGAVSFVTDVTLENISDQPIQIRVESEVYQGNTVSFRIFVSSGSRDISPGRLGRFEIAEKTLVKRRDPLDPFPRPVLWCSVEERETDGVLEYSFGLPRSMLPRASFTFRNYAPHGMPAFDGYRVLLKEFAP